MTESVPEFDEAMKVVCDAPSPRTPPGEFTSRSPPMQVPLQWLAYARVSTCSAPCRRRKWKRCLTFVNKPEQLQKLVDSASSYLVLTDGHKIACVGANLDQECLPPARPRRGAAFALRRQPFRRDVEWSASE